MTLPSRVIFDTYQEVKSAKTWSEAGSTTLGHLQRNLSSLVSSVISLRQSKGHNASKYVSSNFVDSKGRISGVNPAPALTRQWEIKDSKMHDEILKTNGTIGVEVLTQNFYINPAFQGVTF